MILHNSLIQLIAPSVFASQPWERMSNRYGFVPTIEVIDMLRREDFGVTRVMQSRTRTPGKEDYTKHMVRMRHLSYVDQPADEIPEIVIINSHDGGSCYHFMAGIFRLVCSNGLVISSADFGALKVRHIGGDDLQREVLHASRQIIDHAPLALDRIERWKGIELSAEQQVQFAEAALELKPAVTLRPSLVLQPRRSDDCGNDLWRIANRVQENLVRGGLPYRSATLRRMYTRPIASVDGDITINRAVWELAQRFEQLRVA